MTDTMFLYLGSAVILFALGYLIGAEKLGFGLYTFIFLMLILLSPMIFNAGLWVYSSVTPEVVVPSVLGQPSQEAMSMLSTTGLKGEISGVSFSNGVPGTILSQQPEPGKTVKSGRTVRLVVGAGEGAVIVPNLLGRSSQEAESILSSAGLKIGEIFGALTTEAIGSVSEQSPPAGDFVQPNTNVSITVNIEKAQ